MRLRGRHGDTRPVGYINCRVGPSYISYALLAHRSDRNGSRGAWVIEKSPPRRRLLFFPKDSLVLAILGSLTTTARLVPSLGSAVSSPMSVKSLDRVSNAAGSTVVGDGPTIQTERGPSNLTIVFSRRRNCDSPTSNRTLPHPAAPWHSFLFSLLPVASRISSQSTCCSSWSVHRRSTSGPHRLFSFPDSWKSVRVHRRLIILAQTLDCCSTIIAARLLLFHTHTVYGGDCGLLVPPTISGSVDPYPGSTVCPCAHVSSPLFFFFFSFAPPPLSLRPFKLSLVTFLQNLPGTKRLIVGPLVGCQDFHLTDRQVPILTLDMEGGRSDRPSLCHTLFAKWGSCG